MLDAAMIRRCTPLTIVLAILMTGTSAFSQSENGPTPSPDQAKAEPVNVEPPEQRWLDRLDRLDRALLEQLRGYAPPAFTEDLRWHGTEPLTWDDLRGKVVIIQSWCVASHGGRRASTTIERLATKFADKDVQILLLHTPEDAGKLDTYFERRTFDVPVVVDARGGFCDALGVYRDPVNLLIGRNGAVQYVGIKPRWIEDAVKTLLDKPGDPEATPPPRTVPEAEAVEYPPIEGSVGSAKDLRGKPAPRLSVTKWVTDQPSPGRRVVVVDFWATWCKPCVAAIPHMNKLAQQFRDDVIIVGLSNERSREFDRGLIDERLEENDFEYALALDWNSTMQTEVGVRAIPHCLVISSDWVVRWQGNPRQLNAETLRQIVRANQGATTGGPTLPRNRWSRRTN
jgi:thiol-disulfide isomerase/thioredoxin